MLSKSTVIMFDSHSSNLSKGMKEQGYNSILCEENVIYDSS